MNLPTVNDLPEEIAETLIMLDILDDQQLWQAAQRKLPQRTLPFAEEQELALLLDRLENVGLVRAKAAALLRERGHDVSSLLPNS